MTPLQERFRDLINQKLYYEGKSPTDISKACSEITLEMMGKFAEWLEEEAYTQMTDGNWWCLKSPYPVIKATTSELIQKFLNETK